MRLLSKRSIVTQEWNGSIAANRAATNVSHVQAPKLRSVTLYAITQSGESVMRSAVSCAVACLLLVASSIPASAGDKKIDPESSPLACALYVAESAPKDEYGRDQALKAVGDVYVRLGAYEKAMEALRAQTCADRGPMAVTLAFRAIENGRNDEALRYIDEALKCDWEADKWPLEAFVDELVNIGRLDRARAVVEMSADESFEHRVLIRLAGAYLEAGQTERAAETFGRVLALMKADLEEWGSGEITLVGDVAAGFTSLGDFGRATAALSVAATLAAHEKDNGDHAQFELAVAYAKTGRDEEALRMVAPLDEDRRISILRTIAATALERGQQDKARGVLVEIVRLVDQLDDEYGTGFTRMEVARLCLQLGMPEQAVKVAADFEFSYARSHMAADIAEWALAHGRSDVATEALDSATAVLRTITSEKRDQVPSNSSTSTGKEKAMALSLMTDAYLKAGWLDKARDAAGAIDLPQWKANKLADVAGAMTGTPAAAKALLNRALTLSTTEADFPLDTDPILTQSNIARRFAELGDEKQALDIFACLLEPTDESESVHDRPEMLIHVGFDFEKAGLKVDGQIRSALRRIASASDLN
jgi:tetratricopeptide (TPR) repeat protein